MCCGYWWYFCRLLKYVEFCFCTLGPRPPTYIVPLHPAWLYLSSPGTTGRLAAVSVGAAPNLWLYFMDRRYIKRSAEWLQWGLEPQGLTIGSVECSCKTLHFQPVRDNPHGPFWWSLWKACKRYTGDCVPAWPPHLWRSWLRHVEGSQLQRKYCPWSHVLSQQTWVPAQSPARPVYTHSGKAGYTPGSFFGFFPAQLNAVQKYIFFKEDSLSLPFIYLCTYLFTYLLR